MKLWKNINLGYIWGSMEPILKLKVNEIRRLAFWDPVLNTIKLKLSAWKSRFLSFGGRLTLLKSVLTSLPVYALSFFKALSGIISFIESLFRIFFAVGVRFSVKLIGLVGKLSVLVRRTGAWVGVRQLREFNLSLLGKWCWRMLVDRGDLWYRVLAARYGEEAGRLAVGGRSVSCWWREVLKIRDGIGEEGEGWFAGMVSQKVGDGVSTSF